MFDMNEMATVIATGFGLKVVTAIIGAFSIWLMVRIFDKIGGTNFREMLEQMEGKDYALYAGLRILAIAIFMGLVFSG